MKSKGFLGLCGALLLALALLALPGAARAEMYVEGYIGGVQGANASMDVSASILYPPNEFTEHVPGRLDPAVMGGLKIGTWFVKEGFLGYDYPDCMKYFGFYLDFSYHRLNFRPQFGRTTVNDNPADTGFSNIFSSEGSAATLAFMFAARYGFLPDSEVPFGRLQPYVAVGPAILFDSQNPSFQFMLGREMKPVPGVSVRQPLDGPISNILEIVKPGSQSTAVICLAAEAGVRWMCLKNVSVDVSFKYRYAAPSFTYNYNDLYHASDLAITSSKLDPVMLVNSRRSFTLDPSFNLFSGQVGVAYHF